ncbi:HlyD family efflux transporter periplasmic adaptor subunit [Sphingobacterium sp. MYb382]|uniref:HlyD family efflux transporter periplasmic adaptor subunit n=1 Tax=Sphingobacterium sp. MYb382 TaxID=2745278 RepID=UPI0030B4D32F
MAKIHEIYENINSEDLQEIISKPPSWLLKRGISFILLSVLLILGMSFYIKYPEMVLTEIRFTTTNSPKVIINPNNGILVRLLVKNGEIVNRNQDIAYLESTASHADVIDLLVKLKELQSKIITLAELDDNIPHGSLNLGELQGSYQSFYISLLNYQAIKEGGIYQKRRKVLQSEVGYVNEQNKRIQQTYELQRKELELAETEYEKYKQLAEKKIISSMELQQKEALLLSKRQTIPNMENSIITNRNNLLTKNREIIEVENEILEEEKKFVQSLNSLISEAEEWKKRYVLSATVEGKLVYAGFWQENQYVKMGEELFYINPNKDDYYGEAFIPQYEISKIEVYQQVLIKVHSYPYQEYGYLKGKVSYISDIPIKDSVFFARIDVERTERDSLIRLKPGIHADAEIITADVSIFKRIWMNLVKSLNY